MAFFTSDRKYVPARNISIPIELPYGAFDFETADDPVVRARLVVPEGEEREAHVNLHDAISAEELNSPGRRTIGDLADGRIIAACDRFVRVQWNVGGTGVGPTIEATGMSDEAAEAEFEFELLKTGNVTSVFSIRPDGIGIARPGARAIDGDYSADGYLFDSDGNAGGGMVHAVASSTVPRPRTPRYVYVRCTAGGIPGSGAKFNVYFGNVDHDTLFTADYDYVYHADVKLENVTPVGTDINVLPSGGKDYLGVLAFWANAHGEFHAGDSWFGMCLPEATFSIDSDGSGWKRADAKYEYLSGYGADMCTVREPTGTVKLAIDGYRVLAPEFRIDYSVTAGTFKARVDLEVL